MKSKIVVCVDASVGRCRRNEEYLQISIKKDGSSTLRVPNVLDEWFTEFEWEEIITKVNEALKPSAEEIMSFVEKEQDRNMKLLPLNMITFGVFGICYARKMNKVYKLLKDQQLILAVQQCNKALMPYCRFGKGSEVILVAHLDKIPVYKPKATHYSSFQSHPITFPTDGTEKKAVRYYKTCINIRAAFGKK
eukprot:Nk52_evm77s1992 gene=Nk52_evmTU77s1992